MPGLSTFTRPQVSAVLTTARGNHPSAQISTQKCLEVGQGPLLTLSGPALACFGQPSPVTGRPTVFETALVSVMWNSHSRERHAHALHIAKLRKTSFNGSLPGFSALLVMTFYLVLVTDNVHSTSRPSCSDLLCDFLIQVDKDRKTLPETSCTRFIKDGEPTSAASPL